ncbi:MAG: hypothetical protein KF861_22795, partial [Planctomycetaceae bacterium]|nr:hypothetical protein [Planctomycetaceae bacterium]
FASRLVPVATVNPKYVGWERDLEDCLAHVDVKGIALWPEHHGYHLADDHGRAALARIMDSDLPVVLTQRLEDRRQRHHWDIANDLTTASLIEAATAYPKLRFFLCNWSGLQGSDLRAAGLSGRCLIDFARLQLLMTRDVPKLLEYLPVESIAFGSHLPFDYLGPSLVKLANVEAMLPDDYERFAWRNAAEFFRLEIDSPHTDSQGAAP